MEGIGVVLDILTVAVLTTMVYSRYKSGGVLSFGETGTD